MKTTLEKLQDHLAQEVTTINGRDYKDLAPVVVCADDHTLSVQASRMHYSSPRDNHGPYTSVEVWYCGSPPQFAEYGGGSDPYGYVPINLVCAVIDEHGGFKS